MKVAHKPIAPPVTVRVDCLGAMEHYTEKYMRYRRYERESKATGLYTDKMEKFKKSIFRNLNEYLRHV